MKRTKINISGGTEVAASQDNWQEGWRMTRAVAQCVDNIMDDDSDISGTLLMPVACRSDVENVNKKFPSLIEVDDTLQQFEDIEVCKAISAKYADNKPITRSSFHNLSTCNLSGNPDIRFFDEFEDTSTTAYANNFSNCPNLKRVGLSNITSISGAIVHSENAVFCFYNVKSHGRIGSNYNNGGRSLLFIAFPSVGTVNGGYNFEVAAKVIDYGKRLTVLGNSNGSDCNLGSRTAIVRATNVPSLKNSNGDDISPGGALMLFVPSESVDSYIAAWKRNASNTFAIGGSEWQKVMSILAYKHAKEYAGWTDEQIENADYSRPYVDYNIFGLDENKIPYVLFDDPEVERVLLANATHADENVITKEEAKNVSLKENLFADNTQIKYFDELELFGITSIPFQTFKGCTNLKSIRIPSSVTSIARYAFYGCTSLNKVNVEHVENIGTSAFDYSTVSFSNKYITKSDDGLALKKGKFIGLPNLKSIVNYGLYSFGGSCGAVVLDLGLESVPNSSVSTPSYLKAIVLRSEVAPSFIADLFVQNNGTYKIFVPNVEEYLKEPKWIQYQTWGRLFEIGGSEWKSIMRDVANMYANEYAGWSDADILSADYSDPYIDYDIFGFPRPE